MPRLHLARRREAFEGGRRLRKPRKEEAGWPRLLAPYVAAQAMPRLRGLGGAEERLQGRPLRKPRKEEVGLGC